MATKLLLIEDVEDLGRSGDVVSVKEGYSRNFLLPRGLAVKADKNALRRQETLKEARLKQAVADKAESAILAEKLTQIEIKATVKTDPEGKMYGSVTSQNVVDLVKEQHGLELDKKFIQLKQPVKEIGRTNIELKLKEGVLAAITLLVIAEGMSEEALAIAEAKESSIVGNLTDEDEESSEE